MSLNGDSWIDDPAAYVISVNIHRRHLSAKDKRDLIEKLLKAQPEKSDRQIAKTVKVDHKTVASVRAEKEGREGKFPTSRPEPTPRAASNRRASASAASRCRSRPAPSKSARHSTPRWPMPSLSPPARRRAGSDGRT